MDKGRKWRQKSNKGNNLREHQESKCALINNSDEVEMKISKIERKYLKIPVEAHEKRKNKLKPGKFIENYVHEIQQNVLYFFVM